MVVLVEVVGRLWLFEALGRSLRLVAGLMSHDHGASTADARRQVHLCERLEGLRGEHSRAFERVDRERQCLGYLGLGLGAGGVDAGAGAAACSLLSATGGRRLEGSRGLKGGTGASRTRDGKCEW